MSNFLNSKGAVWTGRVMSGLAVLFLAPNVLIKLIDHPIVQQTMTQLQWPTKFDVLIGLLELVSLVLYVIPRTAVLGMILMTGVIGGAIATHLRIENPLFSHTLFGVYLGVWMWLALWLRSPQLRAVIPLRTD